MDQLIYFLTKLWLFKTSFQFAYLVSLFYISLHLQIMLNCFESCSDLITGVIRFFFVKIVRAKFMTPFCFSCLFLNTVESSLKLNLIE